MKTEWRLFLTVAAFFIIASPLYGWWTWYEFGAIEWVGTVALLLCFALTSMIGGFFLVVARRIEPRPEDRPDAEIEEGAGEVGFFSPGSYWPSSGPPPWPPGRSRPPPRPGRWTWRSGWST